MAGLWRRLVVALVCGAPLADASMTFALAPQWRFGGWQLLLLVLTVPVLTYSAAGFYRGALAAARARTASMDTLITLGVLAATGWSLYAMTAIPEPAGAAGWAGLWAPSGSLYLDVAAGVVCFALAGRLWEATARRAAGSALRALAARTARTATRLDDDGREQRIPAAELQVSDRFLVRPGELVAADGTVTDGACALDTSALTGESRPASVGPGDEVRGGAVVLDGRLEVTATRVGADTTWAQLVALVERAQHDKAAIARLTDRISAVFVPAVIALAVVTAVALAAHDRGSGAGGAGRDRGADHRLPVRARAGDPDRAAGRLRARRRARNLLEGPPRPRGRRRDRHRGPGQDRHPDHRHHAGQRHRLRPRPRPGHHAAPGRRPRAFLRAPRRPRRRPRRRRLHPRL